MTSSLVIQTSRQRLERAKQNTLVETNAQAIAETLRQLCAAPEIHRRRWVWELIQNAADARDALKGQNKIEIEVSDGNMVFRHNGAPFDEEELSHLIYHGSTKQADPTKKGKFGSGFITIHLVSEAVKVESILKDDNGALLSFSFNLDRSGTAPEIQDRMEDAWRECLASMSPSSGTESFSTSFTCSLDKHAQSTVETGLAELERVAPYVLALVDELGEISVVSQAGRVIWRKINQERSGSVFYLDVTRESSQPLETNRVVVVGDYITSAALVVLLKKHGDAWSVTPDPSVPRLFCPLPLVGTESLPLPFAIVSNRFEPTEPRNGILAGLNVKESPPTANNWQLLSRVRSLFEMLIDESLRCGWSNAHLLASIRPVPPRDWLNDRRFNEEILFYLISYLQTSDGPGLVETIGGMRARYADLLVPIGQNAKALHSQASEIAPVRDRLPSERLVSALNEIVGGWAELLKKSPEELSGSLTCETLAREIATRCASLDDLEKILIPVAESPKAIDWLNALLEQVPDQRLEALLHTYGILPDQKRRFRSIGDIRMDGGVDEELKDICAQIDDDVRSELLDSAISSKAQALFRDAKGRVLLNEECVDRAIKKNVEHVREDKRTYLLGNAKLLRWLIDHQRADKIVGYPVWAAKDNSTLRKGDPILRPNVLWDEGAREFADVFDANRRLDDAYGSVLATAHWAALKDLGVLTDTIFSSEPVDVLEGPQVEDILSEEVEHKAAAPVRVPQMMFLKGDNGVLAELRKSKTKARRFLEFLVRYVIKVERSWVDGVKVQCTCGSTHTLRPAWLSLVLQNGWVPIGRGKGEKPSAGNLAALLDDGLKQYILADAESARFLLKLDIGLTDLLRVGVPETMRFQLDQLSARIYGSEQTTIASIETVLADVSIRDLVLEKKREKLIIERNQSVGKLIEDLLQKELEAESITVKRRPIGSDFEIESDFVEGGEEQLLILDRYILEVKATSTPFVRMTLRQGIESCKEENKNRYALCVVTLVQDRMDEIAVRSTARFVLGIGSQLEEKVRAAGNLKALEGSMTPGAGSAVEIDMVESQIKLRISDSVWREGYTFQEFLDHVRGRRTHE